MADPVPLSRQSFLVRGDQLREALHLLSVAAKAWPNSMQHDPVASLVENPDPEMGTLEISYQGNFLDLTIPVQAQKTSTTPLAPAVHFGLHFERPRDAFPENAQIQIDIDPNHIHFHSEDLSHKFSLREPDSEGIQRRDPEDAPGEIPLCLCRTDEFLDVLSLSAMAAPGRNDAKRAALQYRLLQVRRMSSEEQEFLALTCAASDSQRVSRITSRNITTQEKIPSLTKMQENRLPGETLNLLNGNALPENGFLLDSKMADFLPRILSPKNPEWECLRLDLLQARHDPTKISGIRLSAGDASVTVPNGDVGGAVFPDLHGTMERSRETLKTSQNSQRIFLDRGSLAQTLKTLDSSAPGKDRENLNISLDPQSGVLHFSQKGEYSTAQAKLMPVKTIPETTTSLSFKIPLGILAAAVASGTDPEICLVANPGDPHLSLLEIAGEFTRNGKIQKEIEETQPDGSVKCSQSVEKVPLYSLETEFLSML